MNPIEARESRGATHYLTCTDGVTPNLYYKQQLVLLCDGTSQNRWMYLSHADIWVGAIITPIDSNFLLSTLL